MPILETYGKQAKQLLRSTYRGDLPQLGIPLARLAPLDRSPLEQDPLKMAVLRQTILTCQDALHLIEHLF